jgi:lactate permease
VTAALAAAPVLFLFWALGARRWSGHAAAAGALALALALAVTAFRMPPAAALLAVLHGLAFAAWPIAGIVTGAVLLYQLVVATGELAVIEAALAAITPDRRLQALLVGLGLGALLEGAAGFGTPVAIAGAMLAALGFPAVLAAAVVLVANTSAVGFGAVAIGIEVAARISAQDPAALGALVGRNVALVSLAVPFLLVTLVAGTRKGLEAWPAALAVGAAFAAAQGGVATLLGPQLADVAGALAGVGALLALLRVWRPRRTFRFPADPPAAARAAPPRARVLRAFAPFAILAVLVAAWALGPVRALLDRATLTLPLPGLHGAALGGAPPRDALVRLDLLAASATAVLAAAAASAAALGARRADLAHVVRRAAASLRRPLLTVALVLGFAFLMGASGMAAALGGAVAAGAGPAFPVVSPLLGWLGVTLTGSITSSNALFARLQEAGAAQAGVAPLLAIAANVVGGACAQMTAPHSMAVASAGIPGILGHEGDVLRRTLGRSIALLGVAAVAIALQAGPLAWTVAPGRARAPGGDPAAWLGPAALATTGALVALIVLLARRAGRVPVGVGGEERSEKIERGAAEAERLR